MKSMPRLWVWWLYHDLPLGVLLPCLLGGFDPHDFMRRRQLIRNIQFGGACMTDANWQRFWDAMPTEDFVTVILSTGGKPEVWDEAKYSNEGNDED